MSQSIKTSVVGYAGFKSYNDKPYSILNRVNILLNVTITRMQPWRKQMVVTALKTSVVSDLSTVRKLTHQWSLVTTSCLPKMQTTWFSTIWWTIRNFSVTLDVQATTQLQQIKCFNMQVRKQSATLRSTGNLTTWIQMKRKWQLPSQSLKSHCGPTHVRPILRSEDTSTLRIKCPMALTATTLAINCLRMPTVRAMSTMSSPWALLRQLRTFLATMASSQEPISTRRLLINQALWVLVKPSSSRTWLRTTRWNCLVTLVTSLQTLSTKRVKSDLSAWTRWVSASVEQ